MSLALALNLFLFSFLFPDSFKTIIGIPEEIAVRNRSGLRIISKLPKEILDDEENAWKIPKNWLKDKTSEKMKKVRK